MKSETIITHDELPDEVITAILQGRKIEAIKVLRDKTGLGLANAKVLVDRAARERGMAPRPPAFVDTAPGSARGLLALLAVLAAAAAWWYHGGL